MKGQDSDIGMWTGATDQPGSLENHPFLDAPISQSIVFVLVSVGVWKLDKSESKFVQSCLLSMFWFGGEVRFVPGPHAVYRANCAFADFHPAKG